LIVASAPGFGRQPPEKLFPSLLNLPLSQSIFYANGKKLACKNSINYKAAEYVGNAFIFEGLPFHQ
jgi:hypothetical protein